MTHPLSTNPALVGPLHPISDLRPSIGCIRLGRRTSAVQEQVQE